MKDALKLYMVRAGKNGEDENLALDNDVAVIDFPELPPIEVELGLEILLNKVTEILPNQKVRTQRFYAHQMWMFANTIQEGDFIVLPRKLTKQIAIGKVVGPYQFREVDSKPRHTSSATKH